MDILSSLSLSRFKKSSLIVIVTLLGFLFQYNDGLAQSCLGADGVSPVGGGLIQVSNGTICGNLAGAGLLTVSASNVDDNNDRTKVGFEINWGDGTVQTLTSASIAWGGMNSHSYTATNVSHIFPTAGANVLCEYFPTARLVINGAVCTLFTLGTSPRFVRWNTDDQNSGRLVLSEQGTMVVTYEVCAGAQTEVFFQDRSTLNCSATPAISSTFNLNQRTRQYVYGTTNTISGTVQIGAASPAFPFAQTPVVTNANGSTALPAPVLTSKITIPATAQIGEQFVITMRYWNTCNPYNAGAGTPVITTARILVVGQPTAPTGSTSVVCNGSNPASFSISGVPAGKTVKWYNNVSAATPKVPGTVGTLITSGTSTTLPIATAFPGFNNTTADNYIVWASYVGASTGGIDCESPPVAVIRRVRESLNAVLSGTSLRAYTAGTATVITEACPGTSVDFEVRKSGAAFPPPTQPVGGTTAYVWPVTPFTGWSLTAGQGTVKATYSLSAAAVSGTLSANLQYTSVPICTNTTNSPTNAFTVLAAPSISAHPPNRTICEDGNTTFTVTAAGTAPLTYQWQVDASGTGAGAFANVPTAGGDAYTGETSATLTVNFAGLSLGTNFNNYRYRVIVTGACSPTATSNPGTLTMNAKPRVTVNPVNRIICVGTSTTFNVTGSGQPTLTYQWQVDTGSGFGNISNGGPYSNATTAALGVNTSGTGVSMDGYLYRVIIGTTGLQCTGFTAISTAASLIVNGPITTITTTTPANTCAGANLAITATEAFNNGSFASRIWTGRYDEIPGPADRALTPAEMTALLTSTTSLTPTFNSAGLGANKTGQYVLTLTTTDDNGCPSSASITINVTQVSAAILYGYTAGTVVTADLNAQVCAGLNLFLNGNPSGGSGSYTTHTWTKVSGPGGLIGTLLSNPAIRNPTFNSTTTGTYVLRYFVQDTGTCNFITSPGTDISITVLGLPAVTDQAPPAICSDSPGGNTATVNLTSLHGAINGGAVTYAWFTDSGLTTSIADPTAAVVTHNTPVYVRVSAGGCSAVATATYTINSKAVITTQPSVAAVCDLGNTSFSVAATGSDLSYQWQEKIGAGAFANITDGVVGGVTYADATTATLNISGATFAMSTNQYRVIVTSFTSGTPSCPITSNPVVLTVHPYPTISAQPPNRTICENDATTFTSTSTVALPSTITSRQWQVDTGSGFVDIPSIGGDPYTGETTATLSVNSSGTGVTMDGYLYRIVITGTGTCPTTSNAGTLTINPLPTANALTPIVCADLTYVPGAPGISGMNASNVDLTLYDIAVADAPGAPVGIPPNMVVRYYPTALDRTNGTNQIVAPRNITPTTLTVFARVVNTVTLCFNDANLVFTIRPLPTANNHSVQVCENAPPGSNKATVDLTDYNAAVSDLPGGGVAVPADRTIEWYTNSSFALATRIPTGGALGAEENYEITATTTLFAKIIDTTPGTPGCSNIAELRLQYQPRPDDNQMKDGSGVVLGTTYTVCASNSLVFLQIDPTLNPGSSYTWTVPAPAYVGEFELLTGTTGFFIILRFANAIASPGIPISVKETLGTALCDGNTMTTNVVVEGSPSKPVISGPSTVCSGANGVTFSVPPVGGSTYSWTLPPGATITSLPVTAASITVQMSTFSGNVTVVQSSGNGCTSPAADPFPVTVAPLPQISADAKTVCSGQNISAISAGSLTFVQNPVGTTFNWQVVNITGFVTGAIVGDAATGVTSINQTLSNTSGVTATVTYRVTPVGPSTGSSPTVNCLGTSQNLSITVEPQPIIAPLQSKTVCSGSAVNYHVNLSPSGLPANTQYSWPDPDGAGPATARSNVNESAAFTITDVLTNTTGSNLTVTYMITPTVNGGLNCTTLPAVAVVIIVEPQPVIAPLQSKTVCGGTAVNYHVNLLPAGLPANTQYSWPDPDGAGPATAGVNVNESAAFTITDILTNATGSNMTVTYMITPTVSSGLNCTTLPAVPVVITVEPQPVIAPLQTKTICSGSAVNYHVNLSPTSLPANTQYSWPDPDAAGPATAGTSVNESTALTITDILTNTTGSNLTVTYMITPTVNGGLNCTTLPAVPVVITVEPQPVIVPLQTKTICSGSAVNYHVNLLPAGLPANTRYSWPDPDGAGPATSGTNVNESAALTISDILTNTTGSNLTVTYMITPAVNGGLNCTTLPAVPVVITVEPQPVIAPLQTKTICSGSAVNYHVNLLPAGLPANTRYSWPDPDGAGPATAGSNVNESAAFTIADVLTNTTGSNLTVTYMITPTVNGGLNCTTLPAVPVVITVEPQPIIVAGQAKTICSGTAVNYHVNLLPAGLPANTQYSWPDPDAAGPATAGTNVNESAAFTLTDVLTNTTGSNLTVTYMITPTVNGGLNCTTLPAVPVVITVEPQPVIVAGQTKTICSGSAVNYHVNLLPSGLPANTRYSWPDPDGAGPATAGVNVFEASGNTITDILTNNTGSNLTVTYMITPTVNGGLNCTTLPAVPVVITVEPQRIIAPLQSKTVCSGSAVNYHVDLLPSGLPVNTRYSWPDPDGAGPATAGSNVNESAAFTITDVLTNTTGSNLTVTYMITPTVNGGLNCTTLPAVPVVITVEPQPIIVAGQTKTICSGSAVNYHVNLLPASLPANTRYSWSDPDAAGPATAGTNVPESNLNTITDILTNTTGSNLTVTYMITPTVNGGLNCTTLPAVPVVITVEPQPVIVPLQAKTICSGSAVNYHVDLLPSGLPVNTRYSWPDPDGAGPATAGVNVPESNLNTITDIFTNTTGSNLTVTYMITPAVNGGLNCTTLPAVPVVIIVEPQPVIVAGQTKTICSGSAVNYHVNLLPSGLPANTQYSWPDPDAAGPATAGTNVNESAVLTITDILTNTTGSNLTVTYMITPTVNGGLNCTTLPAVPVVITVEPQPIIAPLQAKTICSGSAVNYHVNLLPSGLPANTRYSWPDPDAAGPATAGTNVNESAAFTITDILTNTTGSNLTVTYMITPTVNGGLNCTTLPAVPVVITVEPQPVIVAGQTKTICSGSAVNYHVDLLPASLPANTRYSWPDPDGTGPATAGVNVPESNLNTITDILTNTTGSNLTVTYMITPTVNGGLNCTTLPAVPVVITVEPQPIIVAGQIKTICSGSAVNYHVNLLPAGLPANTQYSWPDPDAAGPATAGTNVNESAAFTLTDVLTNTTGSNLTVTYMITPTVNGGLNCTTLPAVPVVITVEPQPVIAPLQTKTICSGSAVNYHVNLLPSGLPANTRYSWPDPDGAGPATAGVNVFEASGNTITDILTNTTGSNLTVTYMITPTVNGGLNCITLPAVPVVITVEPQPIIVAGQTKTICSGSAVNYHVNLLPAGLPANTQYSWSDPDGAGPATAGSNVNESAAFTITDVLTNTTGSNLTVTYMITPTVNGGLNCTTLPAVPVVITVEPQPIIVAGQTKTICSGSAVNYHVNLLPASLPANTRYSWPDPDGAGPATAGTNVNESTALTITDILTNTTGSNLTVTYMVTPTVNGGLNCTTLPAVPVAITVEPQPVIVAGQIKTICSGSAVNYHVDLLPAGLPANTRYSWPDPDGAGPATAGVNVNESAALTITDILTNTTGSNLTVTYMITPTVNGGLNCTTLPAVPVVITVEPQPVIVAGQTKTVCSGSAVNYHVNLLPAGLPSNTQYSWPDPDGAGPATAGTNVNESAAFTITDIFTNTTGSNLTVTYMITPTVNGGLNCTSLPAVPVVITVEPQPVIGPLQAKTICSGSAVNYHVDLLPASLPANTRYSWPDPDGAGPATAGVNVPESNLNTITDILTNTTGSNLTVTYMITPTINGGLNCTTLPAVAVVITVNPQPVAQPLSTIERCSSQPINFDIQDIINNVAPFTGGNSITSKFKYSVVVLPGDGSGLDLTPSVFPGVFDRTTATSLPISETFSNYSNHDVTLTYTITPINTAANCEGTPFTLKVVYHAEPVGSNFVDTNCNLALDHDIQAEQITNGLPSIFTYTITQSPLGALTLPADRTVASNAKITDTYVNLTGSPVDVIYTITAFSTLHPTCVASTPFTYTVTISPKPTGITDTKPAVCSDEVFVLDPQLNISPAVASTFTWDATYDGSPIPSGTGVITASFTNKSNGPKNAVYTIKPFAVGSGCEGLPFVITVPISPEPVMNPTLANPAAICSTNSVSTNITNVILGTNGSSIGADTYIVTLKSIDAGLVPVAGPTVGTFAAVAGLSDAIANDTYRNTTAAQLKVVYTVTPRTGTCLGDPFDITVSVNPEPVLDDPGHPAVCSSNAGNLSPINVTLGTNGTSVNATSYAVLQITYSPNGGVPTTPPAGVTRTPVLGTGINLIKNDRFNNVSALPVTVTYTIQGTSAALSGGCVSEPFDYTIVINPEPTMAPGAVAACSGEVVSPTLLLTNTAGSPPITAYQLNQVLISDARVTPAGTNAAVGLVYNTNDFLKDDIFFNVSDVDLHVIYKIVPIAGSCRGVEQQVDLTVRPAPAMSPALDAKVCSGSQSGIVLKDNSAANAPLSVVPYSAVAGSYNIISVTPDPSLTVITTSPTGVTTNINEIRDDRYENLTNDPLTVVYRIVPISALGCLGPFRDIVLTVEPKIIAAPVNNTPTICSGTPVNIVLSSPSNPTPNPNALPDPLITFNYSMVSSSGISGNTSATNVPQGFVIADQLINSTNAAKIVTYKVTAVAASASNGVGCSSSVVDVFVTVEPIPKLQPTRLSQTVCEATAIAGVTLNSPTVASAGNGTVVFDLISVVDPTTSAAPTNVSGFSAVGTVFNPGQLLNDALSNSTSVPQVIRYTFRPHFSAGLLCAGTNVDIDITVNPLPVVTATPVTPLTICSGESVEVALSTDTDPSTSIVRWTASASSLDVVGESSGAGETLFQTLLNKSSILQTVDYTITPSFSGCNGTPIHVIVSVNPIPVITVPSKITVCGGTTFSLNLLPLVTTNPALTTFRWEVTDVNGIGTPGQFDGSGTSINQSFNNTTDASATMLYEITPIGPGGCEGTSKIINVSVAPVITAAFVTTAEGICEGTPVFLTFELHGQPPFDFVYNEVTSAGTSVKSVTKSGNIKVQRVTPLVTTTYEIVSAKDALGCAVTFTPKPAVTITVFKAVTANWTANIPPFIGGNSTVTFTNTSTVLDPSQFRYEWSFGTDASPSPLASTNMGPTISVNYNRPGDHYVTLRVINLAAEAAGQECESTFAKKISIPILPLVADFKLTPSAACFPRNITITENTATGNVMLWKVIDSNGRITTTSADALPEFLITTPGVYTIILQTSDSFTGQTAFSPTKEFTVYANPVASFQARPTTVFVPDTELITANFSTGATDYEWQFGDGDTSEDRAPTHFYKIEGIYDVMLIAKNDHGGGVVCKDTIVQKVTAKQGGITKVPNAFTPGSSPNGGKVVNGSTDMNNDVFLPFVKGVEEFNMLIFDRWGNLIFESKDANIGWDGFDKNGKQMQSGVYVYQLTLRLSDGQRTTQMGDITLIR